MHRSLPSLSALLALACSNPPPPAVDAGPEPVDAPVATDAPVAMDVPPVCPTACGAGELCCPDGLDFACMAPAAGGGCPLPDLTVSESRASASARVIWEYFEADDCALVEGCVEAPGWRRIMRFETYTPNHGTGDLRMGEPSSHPALFEYSSCHMHYHFNGYANYELLDSTGAIAATGHKQAFCLEDFEPDGPGSPPGPNYDCSNQGITAGWGDTYGPYLDCQWIDVTDVAAGDYTLRITINGEHVLPEISYDDNVANAAVTIPPDTDADPLAACATALEGPRDCGWTNQGTLTCTPGAAVRIGCGGTCGVGTCSGDTILRVCPDGAPCSSHEALAYGDSECGGGDCPGAMIDCPTSGMITILTADYAIGGGETVTCAIVP